MLLYCPFASQVERNTQTCGNSQSGLRHFPVLTTQRLGSFYGSNCLSVDCEKYYGIYLPTLLEVITYELITSIERSRCPVGAGMTGRVVIRRLKDGGSQKPCRPLRTEGGDAKQPPEIGLLTTTVRKPEYRCPACAWHDERDALHALGMTKGMPCMRWA